VLKFIVGMFMLGASLLAVAVGLALLINRRGLADRLQRYQERDAVGWTGSIALLHTFFRRVVLLYALGLITWGGLYPSIAVSFWLDGAKAGAAHWLVTVPFLSLIALAFAMAWHTRRAMAALGFPWLSFGLAPLKSVPWQVNATFWGLVFVGMFVDLAAAGAAGIN
jgi:hypothetical protein